MDLVAQFIFGVVFGIIGFFIGKACGFNPATLYSDAGSLVSILPACIIILKMSFHPETALESLNDFITWYISYLPSAIIGTAVGNFVGSITG